MNLMSKRCAIITQVIVGLILPYVLLGWGFFYPYWVVENDTAKGLFYSCHLPMEKRECTSSILNQATLGLMGTSFVILFFNFLFGVISVWSYRPNSSDVFDNEETVFFMWNACCFYIWVILYPLAGILILCGCINFAAHFGTLLLGWSFYMCVASGLLILLMILIGVFDLTCKGDRHDCLFQSLLHDMYLGS